MKLAKRIVSLVAVAAIAVTAVSVNAFADRDDVKAKRINFYDNDTTIDVGESYSLNWEVLPTDYTDDIGDIRFTSDDYDIVDVDSYGNIEGINPGKAKITARASKGNNIRGQITITVRGSRNSSSRRDRDEDYYDYRDDRYDRSSSRYYTSSRASSSSSNRNVTLSRTADRDTVVSAVRGSSSGSHVTLGNYASVSMETLQAAAGAGGANIRFDTRSSNNTFLGRVIVNPSRAANLSGSIKLGVHVNNDNTSSVYNKYNREYGNKLQVIYCEQGQFGMNVTIVARFASNARAEDLRFYSYNSSSGTHTQFNPSNVRLDANGYVYFDTNVGGTIIVSEGTLS